jgi:FkbM family methyltransferase
MKNKIIIFLHKIIRILKIENIVIFICDVFSISKWKALPQNLQYDENDRIKVLRNNIYFTLNRSDFTQWQIYANYPELHFNALLNVNKSGNIIDVGCNVGAFSLLAANYLKNNNQHYKIYSFEPYYDIFKKFDENISLNSKLKKFIIKENIALSSQENKKFKFNIVRKNLGANSLTEVTTQVQDENFVINKFVLSDTLDNYSKNNNIKNIVFIKIDVEGMELDVLKGAQSVIKENNPSIFVEINEKAYNRNNSSFESYLIYFFNEGRDFFLEEKKYNKIFLEKASKDKVMFLIKNKKNNFNLFIK